MSITKLGKSLLVLASATFLFACASKNESQVDDTTVVETVETVVTPPAKTAGFCGVQWCRTTAETGPGPARGQPWAACRVCRALGVSWDHPWPAWPTRAWGAAARSGWGSVCCPWWRCWWEVGHPTLRKGGDGHGALVMQAPLKCALAYGQTCRGDC